MGELQGAKTLLLLGREKTQHAGWYSGPYGGPLSEFIAIAILSEWPSLKHPSKGEKVPLVTWGCGNWLDFLQFIKVTILKVQSRFNEH